MVSRIAAFVIWAAVAASAVFWAMRLWAKPIAAPAHAVVVSAASGARGDLSRVFGADAAPVAADPEQEQPDERFKLIGVVAPRAGAARVGGIALIATDGGPPKAYRVGAAVDGALVLQDVQRRGATLGPRGQPAEVDLQLPALPPPGSSSVPNAVARPGARPPAILPQPPRMPLAVPQGVPPPPAPLEENEVDPQADPAIRPTPMTPGGMPRPPT